jgi:hypothetical protein
MSSQQPSNPDRRHFLRVAAGAAATAPFALNEPAAAESPEATRPAPSVSPAFASMKQVKTDVLSIGYAEAGPPNCRPVILLHGWPYDIHGGKAR